jgi:cellobiose-specific phosphotransferase system component IIC
MRIASAFWRRSDAAAASLTTVIHRPDQNNSVRAALMFALALVLLGSVLTPLAATAQNLGTSPQFGQAVQGQQATTVEGTVLNIVNWACNVIAPVIAVACLGVAGWHFKCKRPSNTPVSGLVFVMNSGHERGRWSVGWSS